VKKIILIIALILLGILLLGCTTQNFCGDGVCQSSENDESCAIDCGENPPNGHDFPGNYTDPDKNNETPNPPDTNLPLCEHYRYDSTGQKIGSSLTQYDPKTEQCCKIGGPKPFSEKCDCEYNEDCEWCTQECKGILGYFKTCKATGYKILTKDGKQHCVDEDFECPDTHQICEDGSCIPKTSICPEDKCQIGSCEFSKDTIFDGMRCDGTYFGKIISNQKLSEQCQQKKKPDCGTVTANPVGEIECVPGDPATLMIVTFGNISCNCE